MNVVPEPAWNLLVPLVRARCPRLTPADIADSQGRVDLLSAKIQCRHWISRDRARALVLTLLAETGAITL